MCVQPDAGDALEDRVLTDLDESLDPLQVRKLAEAEQRRVPRDLQPRPDDGKESRPSRLDNSLVSLITRRPVMVVRHASGDRSETSPPMLSLPLSRVTPRSFPRSTWRLTFQVPLSTRVGSHPCSAPPAPPTPAPPAPCPRAPDTRAPDARLVRSTSRGLTA